MPRLLKAIKQRLSTLKHFLKGEHPTNQIIEMRNLSSPECFSKSWKDRSVRSQEYRAPVRSR